MTDETDNKFNDVQACKWQLVPTQDRSKFYI